MFGHRLINAVITVLACFSLLTASSSAADPAFKTWVQDLRIEALSKGVSAATFDRAFSELEPLDRVLELDRRQPEFTQTFWSYLDKRVTADRIVRGQEMLATHGPLLRNIQRQYRVQPRFLVAFWALETNFGDYIGDIPVIAALATLAYDERRSTFFRSHLIDALLIVDQGLISPERMVGSWAGAMGQVQFMPETFRRYAVDHDGDGRRDIWNTLPDAMASAANFLNALGWDGTKTWGREVSLPPGFDWELASMSVVKPLTEWRQLGVRKAEGGDLPGADITASLILPGGHKGPAFLIYQNFRVIMRWNASINYALSVGYLSDLLDGLPRLRTPRPADDRALSRAEVIEIQDLLNRSGFNTGEPDGVVGRQTRAALRAFQRQVGHPPDGYPTVEIIQVLRLHTADSGSTVQ
ncbi:MAG: lytic murein transglycosylase [Alphaproteobacteria bacterium]|nr:lytic murein transglycosylase [Alphaproteobacteria bacterium]